MRFGAWSDDGRSHRRVVQYPGNRELHQADPTLLGVVLQLLGDAQGLGAPFGFKDALVLAPGAAVGIRGDIGAYLPLSTPRASGL